MPATSTEEEVMAELLSLGSRLKERTVRLLRLMGRRKAAEVPNEQKATRVLGLVFAVFFVCWFPFFATNVGVAVCQLISSCDWPPPSPALVSTFAWLGYLSSCANPFIYTVFNVSSPVLTLTSSTFSLLLGSLPPRFCPHPELRTAGRHRSAKRQLKKASALREKTEAFVYRYASTNLVNHSPMSITAFASRNGRFCLLTCHEKR